MKEAFESRYSNFHLAYSFKTNYLGRICQIIKENGGLAEVVSPAEYRYALQHGFEDGNIIYNGVIPHEEKYKAALSGSYVNVDNIEEYKMLSRIARDAGRKIRLGVRVTFDTGNGVNSRFGVSTSSGELVKLMDEIKRDTNVELSGFHCHIGSGRQLKCWEKKILVMIELAKLYNASYIDLGGGMFGKMPLQLSCQFDGYVPTFDEYAEVICTAMKRVFPKDEVALFVEPGTALVGNTMDIVANVVNIKRNGKQTYITLDCNSSDVGIICDCKDVPIEVLHNSNGFKEYVADAKLVGNTCLEFDYIKKGFCGVIGIGDMVVIKNTGAYTLSFSRQFIAPRLPVHEPSGEIIIPGDRIDDMFQRYK